MNELYKIFKTAVEENEEEPPEAIWHNVEKTLDKQNILKYKRRYFQLARIAICALFLSVCLNLHDDFTISFSKGMAGINKQQSATDPVDQSVKQYLKVPASLKHKQVIEDMHSFSDSGLVNNRKNILRVFHTNNNEELNKNLVANRITISGKKLDNIALQHFDNLPIDKEHILQPLSLMQTLPEKNANPDNVQKAKKLIALKRPVKSRITLTAFVAKSIIKNHLDEIYEIDNVNENELKEREKRKFSFSTGLLAGYQIKKIIVQSGISYTQLNSSVAPSYLDEEIYNGSTNFLLPTTYGVAVIDKNYFPGLTSADSLHLNGFSKQKISYITLPLLLKYNIIARKKLSFYVSAGGAVNIITGSKVDLSFMQNASTFKTINPQLAGLKKCFYSAIVGLDASYIIHKNISLTIQPSLNYSLSSINKNTPVKNRVSVANIATGIKISL